MEAKDVGLAALKVAEVNDHLVTLNRELRRDQYDGGVQWLIDEQRTDGGLYKYTAAQLDLAFEVLFAAGARRR